MSLRPLVAFLVLLGLASLSLAEEIKAKPAKERLTGKWAGTVKLDEAKLKVALAQKNPDGKLSVSDEKLVDQLKEQVAKFQINMDLGAEGKSKIETYDVNEKRAVYTTHSSWVVIKQSGDNAAIKITFDDQGPALEYMHLKLIDGDTLHAIVPPPGFASSEKPPADLGMEATFKRVK